MSTPIPQSAHSMEFISVPLAQTELAQCVDQRMNRNPVLLDGLNSSNPRLKTRPPILNEGMGTVRSHDLNHLRKSLELRGKSHTIWPFAGDEITRHPWQHNRIFWCIPPEMSKAPVILPSHHPRMRHAAYITLRRQILWRFPPGAERKLWLSWLRETMG